MKFWVLLVVAVRRRLEGEVKRYDSLIYKTALDQHLPAIVQGARMNKLIDTKNMLLNLKVIYDRLCTALGEEKIELLKSASNPQFVVKYVSEHAISPFEYSLMLQRASEEGVKTLASLGLYPSKMRECYGSLNVVKHTAVVVEKALDEIDKSAKYIESPTTRVYSSASL
jgi:hypothetical protein